MSRGLPEPLRGAILATAALIAVLGALLYGPALFGDRVLSPSSSLNFFPPFLAEKPASVTPSNPALHDQTILFEDHLALARASIRAGHLPLWDPSVGAGRPLGAQQGAPLFVENWLTYILPFWRSLAWIALAKLLIGGLGMACFCRACGLGRAPIVLAGVTFALQSLYIAYLGSGYVDAFSLAPWSLLAAERLASGAGAIAGAALGLVLGLALYNGHPESFAVMAALTFAYLIFRLLARRGSVLPHMITRTAALAIGAVLLACGIGALAITSLLDVFRQGIQLSRAGGHAKLGDLLIGATTPEFFGRDDKHVFNPLNLQVFSSFFDGRPYLGVMPLLLAPIGLLRRPVGRQWFFLIVAAFSLLALLGTPLLSLLHALPGTSLIATFAYTWPLMVAGTVLAAYGLERLLEADRKVMTRGLVLVVLVIVGVIGNSLRLRSGLLGHLGSGIPNVPALRSSETSADAAAAGSLLRFVLLAVVLLIALLAVRREALRRWVGLVLVVVLVADLALIDRGWWPMPTQREVAPPATASLRLIAQSGLQSRLIGVDDTFVPNIAERYGLLDARVVDLPGLKRYSLLFGGLGGFIAPALGEATILMLREPQLKLLDVLAVRWVLSGSVPATLAPGLRIVAARGGDTLLENTRALPRAYVAYGSRPAAGPASAITAVRGSPPQSLYDAPVVEGASAVRSSGHATPAVLTRDSSTRVGLTVHAARPGWLVLADTFFPGWSATVDGHPAAIHAADVMLRAVRVPAGSHDVEFRYQPTSEIATAWLSGALLVGTVAALVVLSVRRRRNALC